MHRTNLWCYRSTIRPLLSGAEAQEVNSPYAVWFAVRTSEGVLRRPSVNGMGGCRSISNPNFLKKVASTPHIQISWAPTPRARRTSVHTPGSMFSCTRCCVMLEQHVDLIAIVIHRAVEEVYVSRCQSSESTSVNQVT